MGDKLVIADLAHPDWQNNRCFDPAAEYAGFGRALYVYLARAARRRGIEVATADVYQTMSDPPARAACITYEYSRYTNALIARGVRPAICHTLESPLVAQKFYHAMARHGGHFRHNFQFRGTQERLAGTSTVFHPLYFPMETRTPLPPRAWGQREHLVLVNSNKRAVQYRPANLKQWVRLGVVAARFRLWRIYDPWLRVPELYIDRIRAIEYFSRRDGFRLYGNGWDEPIPGFGKIYHQAALKVYGGTIPFGAQPKRAVMNTYRFALCFENCAFPGYVTEKIFDCFLSGCVPVYLGAPDIADFAPAEAFIDFRRFGSFSDLDEYLRSVSEQEANHYLDAARGFLASPQFDKYDAHRLAEEMMEILSEALQ